MQTRINKNLILIFIYFVLIAFYLTSCAEPQKEEESQIFAHQQDFSPQKASDALTGSIINLPSSLQGRASSQTSLVNTQATSSGSPNYSTIYDGIAAYVKVAEAFKTSAKEITMAIVTGGVLANAELGKFYSISQGEPDEPTGYKVETGDKGYDWKVSLYFSNNKKPDLITRLTFKNGAANGMLLFTRSGINEGLEALGITLSHKERLQVEFDGIEDVQSLDIRYTTDMTNHLAYAAENWSTLTEAQQEELTDHPEKLYLSAEFDGTDYTIYGGTYHPLWSTAASLNNIPSVWGAGREIYLLKAKHRESLGGARLALALPSSDRDNTDNVFTEDSVALVFPEATLNLLNTIIARLNDVIDDDDSEEHFSGDATVEQARALIYVTYVRGTIPTNEADFTITLDELINFVNREPANSDEADFQDLYESISYLKNPAFYKDSEGFVGTYNTSTKVFNKYTNNNFTPSSDTSEIDSLLTINLRDLTPPTPSEIVNMTITVE